MITDVLAHLGVQEVKPLQIVFRVERTGRILTKVRVRTSSEVERILRNRTMLRGTSLLVAEDFYPESWQGWEKVVMQREKVEGNGAGNGGVQRAKLPPSLQSYARQHQQQHHQQRRGSMSQFPHTELARSAFESQPRNYRPQGRHTYPRSQFMRTQVRW